MTLRSLTEVHTFRLKHRFRPTYLVPVSVLSADRGGRAKAWVCGRSIAGIAGSNAGWDTDVCLL